MTERPSTLQANICSNQDMYDEKKVLSSAPSFLEIIHRPE